MSHRDDESSDARSNADVSARSSEAAGGGDSDLEFGEPLGNQEGVYIPSDDTDESGDSEGSSRDSERSTEADDQREASDDSPRPSAKQETSIDFAGFVLSLRTNCMINIGQIEHPEMGQKIQNLPAARQTIDILKMLERKTQGNLDREERNLLKSHIREVEQAYERAFQNQT